MVNCYLIHAHLSLPLMVTQGFKPGNPRWENQDNYVMEEGINGSNVRAFVVFDGHGEVRDHTDVLAY